MTQAWGDKARYYAKKTGVKLSENNKIESIWLTLLEQEYKSRVIRAHKLWNTVIRDYIRIETGLRLSAGGNAKAIPVKISDGIPPPLLDQLEKYQGLEWLIMHSTMLAKGQGALRFIGAERNFEFALSLLLRPETCEIKPPSNPAQPPLLDKFCSKSGNFSGYQNHDGCKMVLDSLAMADGFFEDLLRQVQTKTFLEDLFSTNNDILGAYFFKIPRIEIYWMPITITALSMDVDIEALTFVALAHEIAHAYTHLGQDIDGVSWDTSTFAASDSAVVEGLAEFYTEAVCERLAYRYPAPKEVFHQLHARSPKEYTIYKHWFEKTKARGEVARASMVRFRKQRLTKTEGFISMIESYSNTLGRKPESG